jgi:hypothetical protein
VCDTIFPTVLTPDEKHELVIRLKRYARRDLSSGCWVWIGYCRIDRGMPRPRLTFFAEKRLVHRLVAEAFLGFEPSSGLQINHTCDNTRCVNPAHLYIGTQADNIRDMYARGRWALKREPWDVGTRKLSPKQVKQIRKKRKRGAKLRELEDQYGISKGQLSRICNGRRWCHASHRGS